MSTVHKVFVSYQHVQPDQSYRDKFEKLFSQHYEIMISLSVQIGDIDENQPVDTVRRIIRDEYLRDSTVTVVLIGKTTWQRKHVDWEIGSSIRNTATNPRSGLMGIFLPGILTPNNKYNPYTIPPRLHYNVECGFATLHKWSEDPVQVSKWIHDAFQRRTNILPDNSYDNFSKNRTGTQWQ